MPAYWGGNDLQLMSDYTSAAMHFVEANLDLFTRAESPGSYNMFFEQLFLAAMAFAKYKTWDDIGVLFPPKEANHSFMTRVGLIPQKLSYIHMLGPSKDNYQLISHIEERFNYEFPAIAQHINNIYSGSKLYDLNSHLARSGEQSEAAGFSNSRKELDRLDKDQANVATIDVEAVAAATVSVIDVASVAGLVFRIQDRERLNTTDQ